MNRLSFSRTQILILLSVWLTFLLSFVMCCPGHLLCLSSMRRCISQLRWGSNIFRPFYFGYALTVLPGGILADKIGYRRTILFSLIGWPP